MLIFSIQIFSNFHFQMFNTHTVIGLRVFSQCDIVKILWLETPG